MAKTNFDRFVEAQNEVYSAVLRELENGTKRGHWMWFVFPQHARLGQSSTSKLFGLGSLEEATTYLAHPILGARLKDCTKLVLTHKTKRLNQIFPFPDDLKFISSMTLFSEASNADEPECCFTHAIELFSANGPDAKTLALLGS